VVSRHVACWRFHFFVVLAKDQAKEYMPQAGIDDAVVFARVTSSAHYPFPLINTIPFVMTEYDSELTGLEFVADVLQPIKLVVWGDLAIRHLGVPVVHEAGTLCFLFLQNHHLPVLTQVYSVICLEYAMTKWI